MRYLILIIAILGFMLSLSAEEVTLISPVDYRILEAQKYELELTPSIKLGKIFAKLSFEISHAELEEADYYSLFLACCVEIERLKINGEDVKYFITTDLHPLHFVPKLQHLELIEPEAPVICYSFAPELFDQKVNTVYIEYNFPMPPWETQVDGSEVLHLGEVPFFYPHNIYNSAELTLILHTTRFYTLEGADKIIDTENLRIIRKTVVDNIDRTNNIDLIKMLN